VLYINGKNMHTPERMDEGGDKWASLAIPMSRIGSRTDAFLGEIDDVCLYGFAKVERRP